MEHPNKNLKCLKELFVTQPSFGIIVPTIKHPQKNKQITERIMLITKNQFKALN